MAAGASAAFTHDGDERFMRLALEVCRAGIEAGQSPFGACIVRADEVLGCAHNRVWRDRDPSAHAEVVTIREACAGLGEIKLPGATIYSTTEPCPMCFSAIHWAGIDRIVYGASIADAESAGFNELTISNETMNREGGGQIEIVGGVLAAEAVELFRLWTDTSGNVY